MIQIWNRTKLWINIKSRGYGSLTFNSECERATIMLCEVSKRTVIQSEE